MLVRFDPRRSVYTKGIDLFSPPGSLPPVFSVRGIDLLVPRAALWGPKSHLTSARIIWRTQTCFWGEDKVLDLSLGG